MPAAFSARRDRAREVLSERGIDALLVTPSSDLAYLAGYRIWPSERLTCLVLPARGEARLVVPTLEAPRARAAAPDLALVAWEETANPVAIVRSLLGSPRRLAVADQMWAAFVLRVQQAFAGVALISASEILRALRARKDAAELAALREVGAAADRAFARLCREARFAGRRERDVGTDLQEILREEGHEVVSFAIVAAGPNGASPHHETADRLIREDDVVVCDFGGTREGYCSDITRTVFVGAGDPPDEVRLVHDAVRRAQEAGFEAARPGAPAQAVDRAARAVIAAAGYGAAFLHRTGHGIGLDGHEHPYLVEGNDELLEPGMVFSIEPGIYLEGKFGVRIEDIVALTSAGLEPLNVADRGLARVR